jgi:hypothetical protein
MARLMPISSLLRLLSSLPLFSSSFPRKRESSAPRQQEPLALSWRTGVGLACLGLFALAQVAVPLRHLAYPGNVRWTEEGYRHSWRVMLTEKTGLVQYRVTDTETGRQWVVSPEEVLTPAQTERMAIQPDLILQTAHIVADEFEGRGIADVEVRADAYVAFNGRPNARLIDPDVDLASLSNSVMPKSWILPAPPYD